MTVDGKLENNNYMKKVFSFFIVVGLFFVCCNAQNIIQITNNGNSSSNGQKQDCPYRINGICVSEDIGGVDARIVYHDNCTWVVFTNYNNFRVTVLYEVGESYGFSHGLYHTTDGTTGTIVLDIEGTRELKLDQAFNDFRGYFSRADYYSIKGMIVRKMAR